MAESVLTSTAAGAGAGAAFGPYGIAIGAGIGMIGGLMAGASAKKAANAQAQALRARAAEIRRRGEINANTAVMQGDLEQSGYFANRGSSGFAFTTTDADSLNLLKQRAAQQAENIRSEADQEANASIAEAGQYVAKGKADETASILGAASTGINAYSKYKGFA